MPPKINVHAGDIIANHHTAGGAGRRHFVVNAANTGLWGDSGIADAIQNAAGQGLSQELQPASQYEGGKTCAVSECVVSKPHGLARQGYVGIIHAVGPNFNTNGKPLIGGWPDAPLPAILQGPPSAERNFIALAETYRNIFLAAERGGATHIDCPVMSGGSFKGSYEAGKMAVMTALAVRVGWNAAFGSDTHQPDIALTFRVSDIGYSQFLNARLGDTAAIDPRQLFDRGVETAQQFGTISLPLTRDEAARVAPVQPVPGRTKPGKPAAMEGRQIGVDHGDVDYRDVRTAHPEVLAKAASLGTPLLPPQPASAFERLLTLPYATTLGEEITHITSGGSGSPNDALIRAALIEGNGQETPPLYSGLGINVAFVEGRGFQITEILQGSKVPQELLGKIITTVEAQDGQTLPITKEDNLIDVRNFALEKGKLSLHIEGAGKTEAIECGAFDAVNKCAFDCGKHVAAREATLTAAATKASPQPPARR